MHVLRPICGLLGAIVVALMLAAPAAAQTFPALSGRVVDEAGILDASRRAGLDAKLADLEARTTDQLVVVTLKSLQGYSIEDYGVRLGRQWKIGQKDKNNGVLLIVAPTDRKVRIEVGYGLEGELTDAVTSFIIQQSILPRFRANDYPGGIERGVDDIIKVVTGDAAEWKQRAARAQPSWFSRIMRVMFGILSWIPEDFLILIGIFMLGAVMSLLSLAWLWLLLPMLLWIGIALGMVSKDRWKALARRQAKWHFLSIFDSSGTTTSSGSGSSGSSSGSSWSSSGSSGGFSGGGGSFGGGGSSGSW
jgi:uncharacterized protein